MALQQASLKLQKALKEAESARKELHNILNTGFHPSVYAIAETRLYNDNNVQLAVVHYRMTKEEVENELAKRSYPKHTKMYTIAIANVIKIKEPSRKQILEALGDIPGKL